MGNKQLRILKIAMLLCLGIVPLILSVQLIAAMVVPEPTIVDSTEVECVAVIGHSRSSTFVFESPDGDIYSVRYSKDDVFLEGRTYTLNHYSSGPSAVIYKEYKVSVWKQGTNLDFMIQ